MINSDKRHIKLKGRKKEQKHKGQKHFIGLIMIAGRSYSRPFAFTRMDDDMQEVQKIANYGPNIKKFKLTMWSLKKMGGKSQDTVPRRQIFVKILGCNFQRTMNDNGNILDS